MSTTSFGEWLKDQLLERKVKQSELAQWIGVYPPQVTRLINGERNPTNEMLIKIGQALRIPRAEMFRAAGLLPPATDIDELKEQILHETEGMSEQDQQEVLAFIRMKNNLRQQQQTKKK